MRKEYEMYAHLEKQKNNNSQRLFSKSPLQSNDVFISLFLLLNRTVRKLLVQVVYF